MDKPGLIIRGTRMFDINKCLRRCNVWTCKSSRMRDFVELLFD